MEAYLFDAVDTIDAAFFSGDRFHTKDELNEIKHYLERWNREVKQIEESLKENEKSS